MTATYASSTPTDTQTETPIATVGPCGSGFLSVDHTVEEALEHLAGHTGADVPGPLAFYDARARVLVLRDGTFEVADATEREGELRARIDEAFAHARHALHRQPQLLTEFRLEDPEDLRPPQDAADLRDFLEGLTLTVGAAPPPRHLGSWWHNLFHRLG